MQWKYPLADLDIDNKEIEAVERVLESRWLTMGSVTRALEDAFADRLRVRHAISVTNGTAALHLACLAAGIRPGDEVILPALTFVATAAAVCYTGAVPVFADISGLDDLTISPGSIRSKLTERTRAILVVHYGGHACDMESILRIGRENNLAVIEDAAHAPGVSLGGQFLGALGDVGCFSFFSNKNLTSGEGGMVTTNDDEIAGEIRLLRSHGMTSLTWDRHHGHAYSYDVTALGYNYRLDEIRAALGLVQLEKLPGNNQKRQALTERYHRSLKEAAPDLGLPFSGRAGQSSCHILPTLLPSEVDRASFMEEMKKQGIQTSVHYPAIHQFQYYKDTPFGRDVRLPVTEEVASREVTLPLYPMLSPADVDQIASSVGAAISRSEKIPSPQKISPQKIP